METSDYRDSDVFERKETPKSPHNCERRQDPFTRGSKCRPLYTSPSVMLVEGDERDSLRIVLQRD